MRRGKQNEQAETRVVTSRPAEPQPEEEGYGVVESAIAEAQEQIKLRKLQKLEKEKGFFNKIKKFRERINSIGQKKEKKKD